MNKHQPNISECNKELQDFLDRPFAIDMLAPVFGEKSVDTLFKGWRGEELTGWYRFRNNEGDSLEFYPEGMYAIRQEMNRKTYLLKTPNTINDFLHDMENARIQVSYV